MSTARVAYSAMKAMVRRIDIDIRASLSGHRARQIFLSTYYRSRGAGAYKRSVKAALGGVAAVQRHAGNRVWLAEAGAPEAIASMIEAAVEQGIGASSMRACDACNAPRKLR